MAAPQDQTAEGTVVTKSISDRLFVFLRQDLSARPLHQHHLKFPCNHTQGTQLLLFPCDNPRHGLEVWMSKGLQVLVPRGVLGAPGVLLLVPGDGEQVPGARSYKGYKGYKQPLI